MTVYLVLLESAYEFKAEDSDEHGNSCRTEAPQERRRIDLSNREEEKYSAGRPKGNNAQRVNRPD